MELTLQIDDTFAKLLEAEALRSGESVTEKAGHFLRVGYSATQPSQEAPKPFKVRPFDATLPAEWTSGSVQELLDMAQGSSHS